jgi:hypothetical protein
MQYILTEQEYKALQQTKKEEARFNKLMSILYKIQDEFVVKTKMNNFGDLVNELGNAEQGGPDFDTDEILDRWYKKMWGM